MKLDIPDHKKPMYQMTLPVRWGDMDAMGHVNNAVYFRYMETARIDWFVSLGLRPNPGGQGPIIVNAFCNFIRQIEYPDDILLKTFVSGLGRSSFDSWVTMERAGEPGVICASGGATIVWVDFPRQKSAPLPEWLRQRLSD
jgi:acyl-CoA thioester hydrolase